MNSGFTLALITLLTYTAGAYEYDTSQYRCEFSSDRKVVFIYISPSDRNEVAFHISFNACCICQTDPGSFDRYISGQFHKKIFSCYPYAIFCRTKSLPNPTSSTAADTTTPPALLKQCRKPSGDDCFWYENCLDKFNDCKNSSAEYAINFGKHYCEKYSAAFPSFSKAGQQWIGMVRKCLQQKLADQVGTAVTCTDLKEKAFASHPDCYVQSGLCDLPFLDWIRMLGTVGDAFFRPSAAGGTWANSATTANQCKQLKIQAFKKLINDGLDEAEARLLQGFQPVIG